MAWFNAVSIASGLSVFQLEKKFATSNQVRTTLKGTVRPCLWDKYRRGEVVPRTKDGAKGNPSLVTRVEEAYPGTARWLSLPLWHLASDQTFTMADIKEIYEGLPSPLKELFTEGKPDGKFWRREDIEPDDAYSELLLVGGLDAATAILAMIREAEIIQNRWQHYLGRVTWTTWARNAIGLNSEPVLEPIMEDLHSMVMRL